MEIRLWTHFSVLFGTLFHSNHCRTEYIPLLLGSIGSIVVIMMLVQLLPPRKSKISAEPRALVPSCPPHTIHRSRGSGTAAMQLRRWCMGCNACQVPMRGSSISQELSTPPPPPVSRLVSPPCPPKAIMQQSGSSDPLLSRGYYVLLLHPLLTCSVE